MLLLSSLCEAEHCRFLALTSDRQINIHPQKVNCHTHSSLNDISMASMNNDVVLIPGTKDDVPAIATLAANEYPAEIVLPLLIQLASMILIQCTISSANIDTNNSATKTKLLLAKINGNVAAFIIWVLNDGKETETPDSGPKPTPPRGSEKFRQAFGAAFKQFADFMKDEHYYGTHIYTYTRYSKSIDVFQNWTTSTYQEPINVTASG